MPGGYKSTLNVKILLTINPIKLFGPRVFFFFFRGVKKNIFLQPFGDFCLDLKNKF